MRRLLLVAGLCASPASAGPPYTTDDPQPTDYRHWEIYTFATGNGFRDRFEGAAGLDLNYGVLPGVQLTATLPVEFSTGEDGSFARGAIETGVKYRFLHRGNLAVAIFPRLIEPPRPDGTGFGRVMIQLPLWIQRDIGPWSIFGGGGYTINPGAGNRGFGQAGIAVTRSITDRLSLGTELNWRGADVVDGRSYASLHIGGSYRLGGPVSLLLAGGPALSHRREGGDYNIYAALQFVL